MDKVKIELENGAFTTVKVADKSVFDEYRHKDGRLYGTVEVTSKRKGLFLTRPPCGVIIKGKIV
jgi:hypothetical protein